MARLTRAQSQARTRGLLVDAATTLFVTRGFAATSLEVIGEEAGFTRGAVYSNFASKAEIGLAVLDTLYASVLQSAIEASAPHNRSGPATWVDAMVRSLETRLGDPAWTRLEIEIAAVCTDAQLRDSFAKRYATLRSACEAGFRSAGVTAEPDQLAFLLVSAVLGAALQRATDPTLSFDWIAETFGRLAMAAEPPPA